MPAATVIRQFLMQAEPFHRLSTEELDRLVSLAVDKPYAKGETIYNEGETASSVWIVREGRIQIFKYTTGGRAVAIESLGPRDIFGTFCRIGTEKRQYPCTAVSATESAVIQILDRTFMDVYNRVPALVRGMCTLCSQRLSRIHGLSCQGQEPVEKRIAMTLLQLQKQHGATIPLTKREVGELSGTTVETTIRTLSQFSRKGLVSSERGRITLKSVEALSRLITSEH